jgi:hypothetical protein
MAWTIISFSGTKEGGNIEIEVKNKKSWLVRGDKGRVTSVK